MRKTSQTITPEPLHPALVFALIFTATFLLHASVLRIPYFWDEAGYFIPAAYDLYRTGDLIPHTTLSNAHPPLLEIYLAAWWKLSNFAPVVTRTAMLIATAFGLLGVYKIARHVSTTGVAVATVALTSLYSVFFAQSSLAQLDIGAMVVATWALYFYITDRHAMCVLCSALACVVKETAIVFPLTFFAWDTVCWFLRKRRAGCAEGICIAPKPLWKLLTYALATVPLLGWYAYHYHRTGFALGNPEYLRYNVGATLHPLRIFIALLMRIWHVTGYMNLFVLTGATIYAMTLPPLSDDGEERLRIAIKYQIVFFLVTLALVVEYAVLGGAVLARYMVPVIPLVILVCVSTLRRRLRRWPLLCGAVGVAFILALVFNPPWRIAPEDNLAYGDFVRLHRSAASYVSQHYAQDRILTAWPASDELNRPFLGYVKQPLTVVRLENFTLGQVVAAAQQRESYDVVVVFNTKYEPPRNIFSRFAWWNRIQERFFDYHTDLRPREIAEALGGRVAWQQTMGGQWIAVIEIDKIRNARLNPLTF